MAIQSVHNLRQPQGTESASYGIRVSLRSNDPFRRLLGPDWHRDHWFSTLDERDAALTEMSRKHEYSRATDSPALEFTRVQNLAASHPLRLAPLEGSTQE
jgi:hypothetical protein